MLLLCCCAVCYGLTVLFFGVVFVLLCCVLWADCDVLLCFCCIAVLCAMGGCGWFDGWLLVVESCGTILLCCLYFVTVCRSCLLLLIVMMCVLHFLSVFFFPTLLHVTEELVLCCAL